MTSVWSVETSFQLSEETRTLATGAFERLLERQDVGFIRVNRVEEAIEDCYQHLDFFEDKKALVVIGLGGSSLAARAFYQGLSFQGNLHHCCLDRDHSPGEKTGRLDPFHGRRIFFLDNVDTNHVDDFLKSSIKWKAVGWLVISKSGTTMETRSLYNYCYSAIHKQEGLSIIKNTVVITEQKESPLYDFAVKNKCPLLSFPLDVGGRFSAFTSANFFPLAFMGVSLKTLEEGHKKALASEKEVVEMAGQLWASHLRGEVNLYSFQYSDSLEKWSLWLQQVWSESLSKTVDRKGQPAPVNSTFIPCRGTSDQHSVFQQIIEGLEKKFVCFHRVLGTEISKFRTDQSPVKNPLMEGKGLGELFRAEMLASQNAVRESGYETMTLTTEQLTDQSLSLLMGLWLLVTGTLGELLNINAFDQPGVESGKKLVCRFLDQSR